jgi:hypothetical protein
LNKYVKRALTAIAIGGCVPAGLYLLDRLLYPQFRMADVNGTWEAEPENFVVYARVWNEGADGNEVVYCKVTKDDLTTISKSQQVYLHHNEETVAHFYFSYHGELEGRQPVKYQVWTG